MIQSLRIPTWNNDFTAPMGPVLRFGVVVGPFAIHIPTKVISLDGGPYQRPKGWTVTHIQSGNCLSPAPICCFRHAREIALALKNCGVSWDFGSGEIPRSTVEDRRYPRFSDSIKEDMHRAKEIYRQLRRERECPE